MRYSAFLTLWKAFWTYAQTVGVLGAADVVAVGLPEDRAALLAQWPVLVIALAPALWKVIENVRKNWLDSGAPLWEWPWARLVKPTKLIVLLSLSLALSGCAGFGGTGLWRPAVGDHSASTVIFDEETAAGDKTRIEFKATGEAASKSGVHYTGATGTDDNIVTPWDLNVQGDASVTSPQALAVAQGYAALLEKTPETIGDLASQIMAVFAGGVPDATAPGGTSIKEMLVRFLLERAAALFPGLNPSP